MGVSMHAKSDSEVTSIDASTPPRSPRRPLYYVQSPSHSQHHDLEKMSYGSSPFGSPTHHHFHSPIHHSRESSSSRFSASLKNPVRNGGGWRRMQRKYDDIGDDEEDDGDEGEDERRDAEQVRRFYVICFVLSFIVLFTLFSLILWGASFAYKPEVVVKSISFETFYVQAGMDTTGVPTDMLTLNSTVRILYHNPATFFGVHVTSTPLELHYLDLKVASGQMEKFYQYRKTSSKLLVVVEGHQVPLYGGIPLLSGGGGAASGKESDHSVPLNLTFVMRSRAFILGRLVKPKFYSRVLCQVRMRGNNLGKPINLTSSQACVYS